MEKNQIKEDYIIKRKTPAEDQRSTSFPEYEIEIADHKAEQELSEYDKIMRAELVPLLEEYGAIIEESALRRMF